MIANLPRITFPDPLPNVDAGRITVPDNDPNFIPLLATASKTGHPAHSPKGDLDPLSIHT